MLLALSRTSVESGQGSVVVAATAATTFLAHVLADWVASRIEPDDRPGLPGVTPGEELRDALPIAISASTPFVLLLLSALDFVPASIVLLVAVLIVGLQLAASALS